VGHCGVLAALDWGSEGARVADDGGNGGGGGPVRGLSSGKGNAVEKKDGSK
jgi:hypothetical protein